MAENNKTRTITCAACTKFCRNRDKKKLNNLIKGIKKAGFAKIIFSCDFLKNYQSNGHHDS